MTGERIKDSENSFGPEDQGEGRPETRINWARNIWGKDMGKAELVVPKVPCGSQSRGVPHTPTKQKKSKAITSKVGGGN